MSKYPRRPSEQCTAPNSQYIGAECYWTSLPYYDILHKAQQWCCRSMCKNCSDSVARNRITMKRNLHRIVMLLEKALVKWVPESEFRWQSRFAVLSICMAAISFKSVTATWRRSARCCAWWKKTLGYWLIAPIMNTPVDFSGYSKQMFSIKNLLYPRVNLVRKC